MLVSKWPKMSLVVLQSSTVSGVDRHVFADVTALQEALWADGAAEGLLPGVAALVPVQVGLLDEGLVTVRALVRPVAGVQPHVRH